MLITHCFSIMIVFASALHSRCYLVFMYSVTLSFNWFICIRNWWWTLIIRNTFCKLKLCISTSKLFHVCYYFANSYDNINNKLLNKMLINWIRLRVVGFFSWNSARGEQSKYIMQTMEIKKSHAPVTSSRLGKERDCSQSNRPFPHSN